jgi:uncharacterized protein YdhG (YjbR/CyaY superfamily)
MAKAVKIKANTVDEYVAALPAAGKKVFKELRKAVTQAAPDAEEVISYGIPALRQGKMVIWYSAWKEHMSMYPWNDDMVASVKGLAPYAVSRGTIKFPMDEPLPLALIARIVKYRISEVKKAAKTKAK